MKLRLLAVVFFLSVSHFAMAQSDYGWFTGKASASYVSSGKADVAFDYVFNLTNHVSFGTGLGFGVSDSPTFSALADIRYRPLCNLKLIPELWVRGGYMSALDKDEDGACVLCPRLAIVTNDFKRHFNYCLDFGAELRNGSADWLLGIGMCF